MVKTKASNPAEADGGADPDSIAGLKQDYSRMGAVATVPIPLSQPGFQTRSRFRHIFRRTGK